MYSSGLPVLKEGTAAVIEALQQKGCLLKEECYAHKYPYDWRTKLPTIFRATDQVIVATIVTHLVELHGQPTSCMGNLQAVHVSHASSRAQVQH